MAREKDPAEIIETIAQSIRVSQRGARKVKAHRFKELFGYQVLNASRREKIEQLMAEAGIEVRPALKDAGRDDWLVMSMPVKVPVLEPSPDPAPSGMVRAHGIGAAQTPSGKWRCTSPRRCSGRGCVISEEQEAAGFGIRWARGSTPGHVEADLLYFADDRHDGGRRAAGARRVQAADQGRERAQAAAGQARSYALWVIPAYYVITDARIVSVWDFQGAIAPDRELLRVSQADLAGSFGDLYSRLNPRAAAAARQAKISRLEKPR